MKVVNFFTGKEYDVDKLAASLRGKGVESSPEYEAAKSLLIDQTMSCDKDEALHHLVWFATRAVTLAPGSRNDSMRADFLSAYDLATGLNPKVFA